MPRWKNLSASRVPSRRARVDQAGASRSGRCGRAPRRAGRLRRGTAGGGAPRGRGRASAAAAAAVDERQHELEVVAGAARTRELVERAEHGPLLPRLGRRPAPPGRRRGSPRSGGAAQRPPHVEPGAPRSRGAPSQPRRGRDPRGRTGSRGGHGGQTGTRGRRRRSVRRRRRAGRAGRAPTPSARAAAGRVGGQPHGFDRASAVAEQLASIGDPRVRGLARLARRAARRRRTPARGARARAGRHR